jgi:riboflavin kinase/FMN adenylyltransferase
MTVAVGFFDGVHLGHQSILDGADAAFTFRNHPLSVLAPDSAPRLIMDFESRVAAIKACGISDVMAFDFTLDFAKLSPDEFLAAAKIATAMRIRCGANWRFGRGGVGDAEYLRARGFDVEVVPYVSYKGDKVSSTRIRASIERGEIEDANAMLGRPYEVVGSAFEGKGEGTRLGFPTVNVALGKSSLKLPLGVYAVDANGVRAVANYGFAPTFGERAWHEPVMEIHFLGQMPETVRDKPLRISLLRYVRPERRFASLDELKAQIAVDCAEAAK